MSDRAHLILPYHVLVDTPARDERRRRRAIGTTKKGIGPAYEDKARRTGIRAGDLRDLEAPARARRRRARRLGADHRARSAASVPSLDDIVAALEAMRRASRAAARRHVGARERRACARSKRVMLEGAQGTLLDIDHGTYPFVTSSSAVAGGASIGAGIGPNRIDTVIGITKAYTTRVGAGPFPTELDDDDGEHLREVGAEFGSVTGRPRRTGWLDLPALRYAARVNGFDGLALTKLDVLTGLARIKVCVAYDTPTGASATFPIDLLDRPGLMKPVYVEHEGWKEKLEGAARARRAAERRARVHALPRDRDRRAHLPRERGPAPRRNHRASQPVRRKGSRALTLPMPFAAGPLLVALTFPSEVPAAATASPRPLVCRSESERRSSLWARARPVEVERFCVTLARGLARLERSPAESLELAREAWQSSRAKRSGRCSKVGRSYGSVARRRRGSGSHRSCSRRRPPSTTPRRSTTSRARRCFPARSTTRSASTGCSCRARSCSAPNRIRRTATIEAASLALARGPNDLEEALGYLDEARASPAAGTRDLVLGLIALSLDRAGRREQARAVAREASGPDALEALLSPVNRARVAGSEPGVAPASQAPTAVVRPLLPEGEIHAGDRDARRRSRRRLCAVHTSRHFSRAQAERVPGPSTRAARSTAERRRK